ncbi:MAG: DUF4403 family protein [Saprospiraceae bacterium]|nr:DUF4403 family protein [Saprospiraceae bacterium]
MSDAVTSDNTLTAPVLYSSQFNIKIKLSRQELNSVMNYLIQENFKEGLNYEDGYKVKSQLDGPLDIQASQQQLLVQLPVAIEISPAGIFSSFKVNGTLQLQFTSIFNIIENKLYFKTDLSHHQWKKKPVVHVFGVHIPIEAIGNYIIKKYKQDLCSSIDESIIQNIKLDKISNSLKNYFNKPLYSYYDNQIHVFANALDMSLGPISMSSQNLEIPLLFSFESVIADSMPSEFNNTCNFSIKPHYENISSLQIQSRIPLHFMDSLIKMQVENQYFGSGLSKVKVNKSQLTGNGHYMFINLKTEGAYKGELLLSFTPVFDADRRKINLDDFQIQAQKGKGLNKIIFSIVKGIAESRIKNSIEDQLNKTLQEFESHVHQILDRNEIMEGTELNGMLKKYSISKFYLYQQKFYFNIQAELEMEAIVKKIKTDKLILNSF